VSALDKVVALAKPYERIENGRPEHVRGYLRPLEGHPWSFSTPEEFHANYFPEKTRDRLDTLKGEADRMGVIAAKLDPSSPEWHRAEQVAIKAMGKYHDAVDKAVAISKSASGPPQFTAPGGWHVSDEGDRLHVRQNGFHIGYVTKHAAGWKVTRANGYSSDEIHDESNLLGALKSLGVPAEQLS
jgi:hypothetical protein